jgi:DNA-binding transcriptional MerR regulator
MFGLMKARTCSIDDDAKELRRLQYCGTCKTLGSLYGQKTRFLLNHDTVFLGEVLSALGDGAGEPLRWDASFVSRNCLSLPAKDAPIPPSLSFAAAATVVLAEGKLTDHVADSGHLRWHLGQRFYSRSFDEASRWLRDRGFPLDEVRTALASQENREELVRAGRHEGPIAASLAYLAEPTALVTGLFFAHGARFAGKTEAVDSLRSLGRAFGSLVYHLDALEDYARDARTGEFNAYRAVLGGAEAALPAEDSVSIRQQIWSMGVEVCHLIEELPIPAGRKDLFAARLRTNLSARLGLSPKQAACSCVSSLQGVKQPARDARRSAPAASWRESLALLLNLPFLVSIASTLVSPLRFSATGPGGLPEAAGEAVKHAKKPPGGSSGDGGCDCCSGCDCGDCCGGCDC